MSYLRRDRLARILKPKSGDHPISGEDSKHPLITAEEVDETALKDIESIYDDEVKLNLLEETEKTLLELEDILDKRLSTFQILIDPDSNFPLVKALSTLKGDLSLVLDAEALTMAVDIAQDGAAHINGFDVVAAVLGLHGGTSDGTSGMPFAPEPIHFSDCDEMQNLSDIPSSDDGSSFTLKPVDEINIDKEMTKWLDIYTKLWRILKYFPGVNIRDFLRGMRNRWIKRPINRAIRWVECNMINPAWFLLSGEPRSCSAEEAATEPPDAVDTTLQFSAEDLDATGMDCVEASMAVLAYLQKSHSTNPDVKLLADVREERDSHEALKFGTIVNNIKNKDRFADRIENLYDKSKTIPRYKKRYYDTKDSFHSGIDPVKLEQIL